MTIVLTGSSGKTARRIAELLEEADIPFVVASRRGVSSNAHPTVLYDWYEPLTWPSLFDNVVTKQHGPVSGIYLVGPPELSKYYLVNELIDLAIRNGVRKFVLLSVTVIKAGGPLMGGPHQYIRKLASEDNSIKWAVIRASWFMENFSEGHHLKSIMTEGRIYSATGEGKIAFVAADDIAALAVNCFKNEANLRGDLLVTGPAASSYDEVARLLSNAIGKKIEHVKLTTEEMQAKFESWKRPADYSALLASNDEKIRLGMEGNVSKDVELVTNRKPKALGAWVQETAATGVLN